MSWTLKADLRDLRGGMTPCAYLVRAVMRCYRSRKTGLFNRSVKWLSKTTGFDDRNIRRCLHGLEQHPRGVRKRGYHSWYLLGSRSTTTVRAKSPTTSGKMPGLSTPCIRNSTYRTIGTTRPPASQQERRPHQEPTPIKNVVQVIIHNAQGQPVPPKITTRTLTAPAAPSATEDPYPVEHMDPVIRAIHERRCGLTGNGSTHD